MSTQTEELLTFADDDELMFADEATAVAVAEPAPWRILLVDDEPEIHSVTKLALSSFNFDNRKLQFDHAYSAKEAEQVLQSQPEAFALIFLDVVMEHDEAGLQVVNFVRKKLDNKLVRIVLRTGQPGAAPEEKVIRDYDIDDYKAKTELTVQKLHTTVISSLRAYRELTRIESIVRERTAQLAEVNQDLMDSIHYAQRIQNAILPDLKVLSERFSGSFVVFQPRDVVSGDFYWVAKLEHLTIVANVDCTGHGVPGAIMSVIGHNLLNRIVNDFGIHVPDRILHELDQKLQQTLNNNIGTGRQMDDGMDLILTVFNHKENKLSWAGAKRPLYYIRQNELIEAPGSSYPIGDSRLTDKQFDLNTIDTQPGDRFYLFTDGFVDQFGGEGERARKYGPKRFRELLLSLQSLPMAAQGQATLESFQAWRGELRQIDDVCLIGLEV